MRSPEILRAGWSASAYIQSRRSALGEVRPRGDAARNDAEGRRLRVTALAVKAYSVDCVHGIGLLLCCEISKMI